MGGAGAGDLGQHPRVGGCHGHVGVAVGLFDPGGDLGVVRGGDDSPLLGLDDHRRLERPRRSDQPGRVRGQPVQLIAADTGQVGGGAQQQFTTGVQPGREVCSGVIHAPDCIEHTSEQHEFYELEKHCGTV